MRSGRRWFFAALAVGTLLAAIVAALARTYGVRVRRRRRHAAQSAGFLVDEQTVRERSIAVRAASVAVPSDLTNSKRIASGAGQYAAMCSSCHLAPGMKRTEIARGLYPRAPELRRGSDLSPAEEFWVVKHGLKMTGMPAWGVTHDDEMLWDVVAFLRKLPELCADEYQALVKSAPAHEDMMQDMEMGKRRGVHQSSIRNSLDFERPVAKIHIHRPIEIVERGSTMRTSRCTLFLALVLAIGSAQAAEEKKDGCGGLSLPLETPGSTQEQRDLLLRKATECMRQGKRAQALLSLQK